nr:hypothetical protein Itr_chr01CG13100 [Ipomoea trifida]
MWATMAEKMDGWMGGDGGSSAWRSMVALGVATVTTWPETRISKASVVFVKAEKNPVSSPRKEAMFELQPNNPPELSGRSEPDPNDPFDPEKRPFYPLRHAPLPAELVAPQEQLPLLCICVSEHLQ